MPEQRSPLSPAPPPSPRPPVSPPMMPKKKSWFAVKVAVFGIFTSAALGYYGWHVRGERENYKDSFTKASTAQSICEKELTESKQKADVLGGDVTRTSIEKERERAARENAEKGLSEKEKTLTEKETTLQATKAEVEELRRQRAETEKRLQAFKDLTAKFQKMIDTGQLEVVVRDGRMIVKLPAGVLFASGKAELSDKGQVAVAQVAGVLKDLDRKFMVVGHTDSVPLKSATYADNWDLSAARALTVVKYLITAGVRPENLVAAGYGQWDPIRTNKTDAGRQANRRIEIVVMPTIEELPALPEEMAKAADKPQ